MVIRSGDGMTRSTARPAGINGKMRLDKEIRQLQQTSQMGSLPHRCQTSHKVRENSTWLTRYTAAQSVTDHLFEPADGGFDAGTGGVAGRLLPGRSSVLGDCTAGGGPAV